MYDWVKDKEFLGRMKAFCADIVNQLVQAINSEGEMIVKQHLVGSGAKNLITQNANEPIDLDYNLEIVDSGSFPINDCRGIKKYVQRKFDEVLGFAKLNHCQDSTSALTTGQITFTKGNRTPFSIDLCIIRLDRSGSWYRLIHRKTGFEEWDQYYWNEAPQSRGLSDRAEWLKNHDHWLEVRETYLDRKNRYLTQNNQDHHSFNCYIEAVNEVYYRYNQDNQGGLWHVSMFNQFGR